MKLKSRFWALKEMVDNKEKNKSKMNKTENQQTKIKQ